MEILLNRRYPKDEYSIGEIRIDGKWFCSSLEPTDRGLTSDMPMAEIKSIKVAGKTAIPKGRYKVTLSYSPKFKDKSWAKPYAGKVIGIENVPGFEGVRIHPGNTVHDTSGCVLCGLNKIKGGLTNSCSTYLNLVDNYIQPALARKESVYISII